MYLHGIDGTIQKRYLLDILAYFLWDENAHLELSQRHVPFGKKLYKEILEGMKKDICYGNDVEDFACMDMECHELGTIYSLEKRLEKIEQVFAKKLAADLTGW